jgi:hypothetical protein
MIKNAPWQVKASIIILVAIIAAIVGFKYTDISFELMFNYLLLMLGIVIGIAISYFIESRYEGF